MLCIFRLKIPSLKQSANIFQRYASEVWKAGEREQFISWIAANSDAGTCDTVFVTGLVYAQCEVAALAPRSGSCRLQWPLCNCWPGQLLLGQRLGAEVLRIKALPALDLGLGP